MNVISRYNRLNVPYIIIETLHPGILPVHALHKLYTKTLNDSIIYGYAYYSLFIDNRHLATLHAVCGKFYKSNPLDNSFTEVLDSEWFRLENLNL